MRIKKSKRGVKTVRFSPKLFENRKVGWVQRIGNSIVCKTKKGNIIIDIKHANELKLQKKVGDLNKGVQFGVIRFRELLK